MKLFFEGPGGNLVVEVDREMSIGRSLDNDIAVQDTQISRRHALVRPAASGGIEIDDLDSYNGTFVNGQRITTPTLLAPGDTLLLGETNATVQAGDPAIPEDAGATQVAGGASAPFQPPPPPPPAYVPPPVPGWEEGPATVVGGDAWQSPRPSAPPTVPRLVVRTGRDEGKELVLLDGVDVVIGRDPLIGFVLTDGRVSSQHARVYLHDGRLVVEDLGSANGTFVNGAPVTTPLAAEEESEIQLGESVLVFTRRPSSEFAGRPSPTLVGARFEPQVDVHAAVEQAVARSERRRQSRGLIGTAIGGTIAVAAGGIIAGLLLTRGSDPLTEAEVIERVKPSTVRIDSYDSGGRPISGGSGSIIDLGDGMVLTNNHVASVGFLEVVNSVNNRSVEAVLFAAAPCDDLALVVAESLSGSASGLKEAEFGSLSGLRQGDRVIALGYPGAAEQFLNRALSATTGVVSKTSTVYDVEGSGVPHLPDVIQTDAAINPGNSGGPLFDIEGKQIGVNTARYTGPAGAQNENYAVSITRVREILPKLQDGISPQWIGATFAELYSTNTNEPVGLGIEALTPGGPAEAAGLEGPDDGGGYRNLLIGVDGEEVLTLQDYCRVMPEEGRVTVEILDLATGSILDFDLEVGRAGN